jgi:hypothetical protein
MELAVRQQHEQLTARARRHTNLVPLACFLEHPLWRLSGSVEATAARQLGGGGRGERAGRS